MKYKNLADLVNAVKKGAAIEIIVDNDCVNAYDESNNEVYNFDGAGPEGALFEALELLGLKAEPA